MPKTYFIMKKQFAGGWLCDDPLVNEPYVEKTFTTRQEAEEYLLNTLTDSDRKAISENRWYQERWIIEGFELL